MRRILKWMMYAAGSLVALIFLSVVVAITKSDAPVEQRIVRGFVDEATWTDGPWPLTVSRGQLTCIRGAAYFEEPVGERKVRRWPLNGFAQVQSKRNDAMPSIDPIWRDAEPVMVDGFNMAPPKTPISGMVSAAMKMCE